MPFIYLQIDSFISHFCRDDNFEFIPFMIAYLQSLFLFTVGDDNWDGDEDDGTDEDTTSTKQDYRAESPQSHMSLPSRNNMGETSMGSIESISGMLSPFSFSYLKVLE